MTMAQLIQFFDERLQEIESYLQLLEDIEVETHSGPPKLGKNEKTITTQQQKILYSGVFLQLYSLVEACIVQCLDSVTEAAAQNDNYIPGDLSKELRREWVRVVARTHVNMSYEKRLDNALHLCNQLVDSLPISEFKIEKGSSGNWDDLAIENVAERLGFKLNVDQDTNSEIKKNVKDDLGSLVLIKTQRNSLAHGNISFVECGENFTVSDLRNLTDRTASYLREVVQSFVNHIENHQYLIPEKRPHS
jgi:hypothetical protein